MSTQDSKRIVETFVGHFARSDLDAILAMMTDDATWWVNGKPHLYPDAGFRTKAEMAEAWAAMYGLLDGPLVLEVISMIAEDDRVAAELRSDALTKAGKRYDNGFTMIFSLRAGKVLEVREYTDLLHALEVFG